MQIDDKIKLTNTNNNKSLDAHIIKITKTQLVVAVNTIRVVLIRQENGTYIGRLAGIELLYTAQKR